jgi:hypothetical protein
MWNKNKKEATESGKKDMKEEKKEGVMWLEKGKRKFVEAKGYETMKLEQEKLEYAKNKIEKRIR